MFAIHHFRNAGFGLFVLAVSLLYLVSALGLGPPVNASKLTPSFFPLVLGSLSCFFSLALVIRIVRGNMAAEATHEKPEQTSQEDRWRSPAAIAATGVFVLLFQTVGFFASTIPYVFAIILIFSDRQKLKSKLIFSVLITLAGYVIFTAIFNVRLPALLS
ncbi:tripartite tricarboxylate transporter TctB family protein [Granulosicoccus antarcticus]|uniref:DUF1468 domain-containing protein n=1 Tax=Granulosicoccus antarcticus IMCC3135 TaxID=1192854 RepID=A0A2Z2NR01_9GAMM|nr:tripartite tricarboxylate transporter TctB family protein [Granulosicoccus antarcticus]ASJ73906.1 hypothetical protein IMCC3135_19135 [Granulosicoccus antarcticus IMCC3135]